MKYIDADKLIAEIRIIQQTLEHRDVHLNQVKKIRTESMIELCKCILDVIDSFQQEQPSLPSNLDEAAEDSWAVYEYRESPRGLYSTCYVDGFKAGAEWMAGQGVAKEAVVGMATEVVSINFSPQALNELDLCPGDKVVIQIRKK